MRGTRGELLLRPSTPVPQHPSTLAPQHPSTRAPWHRYASAPAASSPTPLHSCALAPRYSYTPLRGAPKPGHPRSVPSRRPALGPPGARGDRALPQWRRRNVQGRPGGALRPPACAPSPPGASPSGPRTPSACVKTHVVVLCVPTPFLRCPPPPVPVNDHNSFLMITGPVSQSPRLPTEAGPAGGRGESPRAFTSPAPAQAALRPGEEDVGWRGLPDSGSDAHRYQDLAVTPRRRGLGGGGGGGGSGDSSAAAAAVPQRLDGSGVRLPGPLPSRSPRPLPSLRAALAALEDLAAPEAAACAICQRTFRDPVRADCGHQFCRACVVQFWAEEDGPFPCPECADDCWQRAVEPGRPPLSRRLLALEVAAAGSARDAPASEAALQLLCRADGGPLCRACRMAAAPEPPEWEPRWRKALRGKENKGSVEIMRKDLNDARDLHGQAESAAAVWKGHVMDRRKKALTDYKKLRAFFVEEEEHFLQEAEKAEEMPEDEGADPAERFRTLLQAVSELEKKHRDLGLSMLLQ
ncbi:E3 ubiquitin-protein ligase RNF187 [Dugong dugon]